MLEGGSEGNKDLETEIKEIVSKRIGKLARPKRTIFTSELPKTRSGKIMRRLLRDIAEGRELGDATALADPGVVEDLKRQTQSNGSENAND
jgi:acetyl-CoA synthetase